MEKAGSKISWKVGPQKETQKVPTVTFHNPPVVRPPSQRAAVSKIKKRMSATGSKTWCVSWKTPCGENPIQGALAKGSWCFQTLHSSSGQSLPPGGNLKNPWLTKLLLMAKMMEILHHARHGRFGISWDADWLPTGGGLGLPFSTPNRFPHSVWKIQVGSALRPPNLN